MNLMERDDIASASKMSRTVKVIPERGPLVVDSDSSRSCPFLKATQGLESISRSDVFADPLVPEGYELRVHCIHGIDDLGKEYVECEEVLVPVVFNPQERFSLAMGNMS
jgi:hypothetical protein